MTCWIEGFTECVCGVRMKGRKNAIVVIVAKMSVTSTNSEIFLIQKSRSSKVREVWKVKFNDLKND